MATRNDELREMVRRKYAEIADAAENGCCSTVCCDSEDPAGPAYSMIGDEYDKEHGYVADADLGLGCGLPVEHAGLAPGLTVLDLGSGAGVDVFVARREVGDSGRVIGVDMTPEMIARARANAASQGYENVEFRLGEIEHLPVDPASVDVVISNCVLNLVPDKRRAFGEIFRVLKPGGHFCISDIVSSRTMPDWASSIAEAYAGCVSGAIPKKEYLQIIHDAGFTDVDVVIERRIDVPPELLEEHLSAERRAQIEQDDLHVMSVTVKGFRR